MRKKYYQRTDYISEQKIIKANLKKINEHVGKMIIAVQNKSTLTDDIIIMDSANLTYRRMCWLHSEIEENLVRFLDLAKSTARQLDMIQRNQNGD